MSHSRRVFSVSWREALGRVPTEDVERAVRLMLPVLEKLGDLHCNAKCHGNVTPDCLRYAVEADRWLLDFKFFHSKSYENAKRAATAPYSAPEIKSDRPRLPQSDVFSVGMLLREVISNWPPVQSGQPPAGSRSAERRRELQDIVDQALATEPSHRFKNATVLRYTLNRLVEVRPSKAPPLPPAGTGRRDRQLVANEARVTPVAGKAIETPRKKRPKLRPLPNGSVGSGYSVAAQSLIPEGSAFRIANISGAEPIGLIYDGSTGLLAGTPNEAGECQLTVSIDFDEAPTDRPEVVQASVLINPDPGSLWRDLPSDQSDPYAKPDADSRALQTRDLNLYAASLRGRSHAHEGKYREDDFYMEYGDAGWHVLVVADGAGSAQYARHGSRVAAQASGTELHRRLSTEGDLDIAIASPAGFSNPDVTHEKVRQIAANALVSAAYAGLVALHAEAVRQETPLREFATTLILVILKRFESTWFVASLAIGDGAAALVSASELHPLLTPDSGEYSGQTRFLTTAGLFDGDLLRNRTVAALYPDHSFLAAMTDGVSDPWFSSDDAQRDLSRWLELRRDLEEKALGGPAGRLDTERRLLEWLNFDSRGNHDDRTIIVAVPHPVGTKHG